MNTKVLAQMTKMMVFVLSVFIAGVFTSCDKNEEIFDTPQVINPVNEVKEPQTSELRAIFDDIYYTDSSPLGSVAGPLRGKRITIPAKTAYCVKLTDEYREMFSSYSIFARFNDDVAAPSGAYFEFDRKRNWLKSDDSGDIPTKTIYPGDVGDTNSFGPQMEGWNQPDFQWIRIRNPHNYPLSLVVTMEFRR